MDIFVVYDVADERYLRNLQSLHNCTKRERLHSSPLDKNSMGGQGCGRNKNVSPRTIFLSNALYLLRQPSERHVSKNTLAL